MTKKTESKNVENASGSTDMSVEIFMEKLFGILEKVGFGINRYVQWPLFGLVLQKYDFHRPDGSYFSKFLNFELSSDKCKAKNRRLQYRLTSCKYKFLDLNLFSKKVSGFFGIDRISHQENEI